jgi:hypothetical protein
MFERGGYTHSEMTENMMAAQQAGNAIEEASSEFCPLSSIQRKRAPDWRLGSP